MLAEIAKGVWLDPKDVSYVSVSGGDVIVGFKASSESIRIFSKDGEDLRQAVDRVAKEIRSKADSMGAD